MRIINSFIDTDFIDEIAEENKELLYSSCWKSSLGWQEEIISPVGSVLIRDLNDTQKETLITALEKRNIVDRTKIFEFEAQAYLWQRLSFIPWHNDKEEDDCVRFAASLYLNKEWKEDWGGLFLYNNNGSIYAEVPSYNKFVLNDNNFAHATTIISTDAPLRLSIQLFWKQK